MNRTRRARILITTAAAGLVLVSTVWLGRPAGVASITVGLLAALSLSHFFSPFRLPELLVLGPALVPGLFTALHFSAGLPHGEAYAIAARCLLAFALDTLLVRLAGAPRSAAVRVVLQLAVTLGVPVLFGLLLLRQPLLLSLALSAAGGVALYYVATVRRHG